MKRALQETTESMKVARPSLYDENRPKKLLKSQNGQALLSLSLLACHRLSMDSAIRNSLTEINVIPNIIPSDQPIRHATQDVSQVETSVAGNRLLRTTTNPTTRSYQEFVFESGALQGDWKASCRPLPRPPRLPKTPLGTRSK